jgi:aspartyl protease family protein
MTNKVIVSIDNAPPRTLGVGQEHLGVRLISVQGNTATLTIDGKRHVMRVGQNVVSNVIDRKDISVTLIADAQGHFKTSGLINGQHVQFLVDTGATMVSLGESDVRSLRLNLDNAHRGTANTANGTAVVYYLKLDTVSVGGITLRNIDCMVNLDQSMPFVLLGMSFLNRVSMQREGDTMVLKQRF